MAKRATKRKPSKKKKTAIKALTHVQLMNFEGALTCLKNGLRLARKSWNNPDISIQLQRPDKHSKMTEPYIYMMKGDKKFPCDLSCESIMAEDWYVCRPIIIV